MSAQEGGVCLGGVCPGVVTFPSVDRMTDACENISFPQKLLRTVNINWKYVSMVVFIFFHESAYFLILNSKTRFCTERCRHPHLLLIVPGQNLFTKS